MSDKNENIVPRFYLSHEVMSENLFKHKPMSYKKQVITHNIRFRQANSVNYLHTRFLLDLKLIELRIFQSVRFFEKKIDDLIKRF